MRTNILLTNEPSPEREGVCTTGKHYGLKHVAKAGKYLGQTARLMIGVPDYDNYVEHMRVTHPDQTPMTYEEFFP